jgi:hypothetical protein
MTRMRVTRLVSLSSSMSMSRSPALAKIVRPESVCSFSTTLMSIRSSVRIVAAVSSVSEAVNVLYVMLSSA